MTALLSDARTLFRSGCVALILVLCLLELAGWQMHWFAHPQKATGLDPDDFIEAQMVTLPSETHLTSPIPSRKPVAEEARVHPDADRGRTASPEEKRSLVEPGENVTKAASQPPLPATHGPVALSMPPPEIPSYLRDETFKTHVIIEFFVTAQGGVIPRLVSSSDNAELDAIALEAVKRWQFRPAEENHRAVDSKVRLRIEFSVR